MLEGLVEANEKNQFTMGIYLDYRKAFDTVNHSILLSKLKYYSVRGVAYDWFVSYLGGRKQYTTYNNEESTVTQVSHGVPQGSILGPLLFIIYVNDMHCASSLMKVILFADDTNVFVSANNLQELEKTVNTELDMLNDWIEANRLSLNVEKTVYMLFKPSKKLIDIKNRGRKYYKGIILQIPWYYNR